MLAVNEGEGNMEVYMPLCEQFACMAKSFYNQFQEYKESDIEFGMEQAAICTIIFQALAIEGYVNLFGSVVLGDTYFRENYESRTDKRKRYNTLEKLKLICKEELKKPYPTSDEHYRSLKNLLKKRDRLVHSKPSPHKIEIKPLDYNNLGVQYEDYVRAFNGEIGFIYDGLTAEIFVYEEMKKNLTSCWGKEKDVVSILCDGYMREAGKAITRSFQGGIDHTIYEEKPHENGGNS